MAPAKSGFQAQADDAVADSSEAPFERYVVESQRRTVADDAVLPEWATVGFAGGETGEFANAVSVQQSDALQKVHIHLLLSFGHCRAIVGDADRSCA